MGEMVLRFLIGGVAVSFFAVLGEIFRPKSFSGLFSAAPSIALATLGITIAHHGKIYAAAESRSMLLGAIAFFCYAAAVSWVLTHLRWRALTASTILIPLWFTASLALFWAIRR